MSKIRNKLIATLSIFALLFTSLSAVMFANNNPVKAEESTSEIFQVLDDVKSGYLGQAEETGKDYAGLRWETTINKAYYDSLASEGATFEFGTLIAPDKYKDNLYFGDGGIVFEDGKWYIDGITNKNGEKIYVSNIVNDNVVEKLSQDNDSYVMYSAIRYEDMQDYSAYATELIARSYVKITIGNQDSYEYANNNGFANAVCSLRNSIAYNIASGNFSEEVAENLKGYIVEDGSIYKKIDGQTLYSTNNDEYKDNTVDFGDVFNEEENIQFVLNTETLEAVDRENGVVTLDLSSKAEGVYYLTAFCGSGNVYCAEILVATTISTAEDLVEYFTLVENEATVHTSASRNQYNSLLTDLKTFGGYYALTNNIDASSLGKVGSATFRLKSWAHSFSANEDALDPLAYTKGLTGTFDGRGYAISNLTVFRGGLFGIINGTVKNVAFNNINHVMYVEDFFGNSAFLATRMTKTAVMENVAIYNPTDTVRFGLVTQFVKTAKLINCYIESPYTSPFKMCGLTEELYGKESNNGYPRGQEDFFDSVVNTIFVSPYLFQGASAATSFDIKDVTGYSGLYSDSTVGERDTISFAPTAKRYQSLDDMVERYALGGGDEIATENGLTTTADVVDSFDNRSGFVVTDDGKISWVSLSTITISLEDTPISAEKIELSIGDSVKITATDMFDNSLSLKIYSDNGNVLIDQDAYTIKAESYGDSNVTIMCQGIVLAKFTISVPLETIDFSDKTIIVDSDGEDLSSYEGIKDATEINIIDNETIKYTFNSGKLEITEGVKEEDTFKVEFKSTSSTYIYTVKYVTKYIHNAEEFIETFTLTDGVNTDAIEDLSAFNGYYLLAGNIDFAEENMQPTNNFTYTVGNGNSAPTAAIKEAMLKVGLTGTFDGNGYTISNLEAPQGGIFGAVSGTIMNVAFVNISSKSVANGVISHYMTNEAVLENVYVKSDKYDGTNAVKSGALLAKWASFGVSLKGCYFEINLHLYNGTLNNSTGVYSSTAFNSGTTTLNNSYAIVVSEQIISHRNNIWTQTQRYDANTIGSNVESFKDGSSTYAVNKNTNEAVKLYRYDNVTKLTESYKETDSEGAYTERQIALKTVTDAFNDDYFSVSTEGVISWITKN